MHLEPGTHKPATKQKSLNSNVDKQGASILRIDFLSRTRFRPGRRDGRRDSGMTLLCYLCKPGAPVPLLAHGSARITNVGDEGMR